jgi:hypothetical protein
VLCWTGHPKRIETGAIVVHWSISRTAFKDIKLDMQEGYQEALDQATMKGSPEIKLNIWETQVSLITIRCNSLIVQTNLEILGEEEEIPEEHEELLSMSKKNKVSLGRFHLRIYSQLEQNEPSPEEEEQVQLIEKLQSAYRCEDRTCKYTTCLISPSGDHVHLWTWAAAIVSQQLQILHPCLP